MGGFDLVQAVGKAVGRCSGQAVILPGNPRTLFAGKAITHRKFNEIPNYETICEVLCLKYKYLLGIVF